jgi:hypothetical protein
MLSNGAGIVLDSLTFGPQTADISLGRCPNGTGPFSELIIPTFNNDNYCPAFIEDEDASRQQFVVIPNPFRDHFTIISRIPGSLSAELYNSSGMQVAKTNIYSGEAKIDASILPSGMYFFILRNENNEVSGSGKIIKIK